MNIKYMRTTTNHHKFMARSARAVVGPFSNDGTSAEASSSDEPSFSDFSSRRCFVFFGWPSPSEPLASVSDPISLRLVPFDFLPPDARLFLHIHIFDFLPQARTTGQRVDLLLFSQFSSLMSNSGTLHLRRGSSWAAVAYQGQTFSRVDKPQYVSTECSICKQPKIHMSNDLCYVSTTCFNVSPGH